MGEGFLRGTEARTDLYHARDRVHLLGEAEGWLRGGGRRVMSGEGTGGEDRGRGHRVILCVRVARVRVQLRPGLARGRTPRIRGIAGVAVGLCRTVGEGEVLAGMIFAIRGRGLLPLSRMRRSQRYCSVLLVVRHFISLSLLVLLNATKIPCVDLRGLMIPLQKIVENIIAAYKGVEKYLITMH